MFILDASSSMTYEWNKDYNRFAIARNILLQIVDSIYAVNNEVEFGVRLYGSEHPAQEKNCMDSKLLVPFNLQNVNQIKRSLLYTNPIGWSPIAYSLRESAASEINNTATYDYSIIFITDGGESCGGDICKTYSELLQKRVSVTPYIIGLDNNETLKGYYNCLGKYVSVLEVDDIPKAVKLIVDENRPILNKKKQLNLKTVFSNSPVKKAPSKKPLVVKQKPKPILVRTTSTLAGLSPTLSTLADAGLSELVPVDASPLYRSLVFNIEFEKPQPVVKRITQSLASITPVTPLLPAHRTRQIQPISTSPLFSKLEYKFTYQKDPPPVKRLTLQPMERMVPFGPSHPVIYSFPILRPLAVSPLFKKLKYTFNYTPIKRDTIRNFRPKARTNVNNTVNPNTKVSREVIPHNETLVQVFFVNKFQKKKMYGSATPTIVVKDANTNKEVKRFIRTVSRGTPDMKQIPSGTYHFMVSGSNGLVTRDIRIHDNSINKIYIEVSDGTIEFAYANNMERPVKEFQAIVNPRFEKGSTVIQECKDKLYYAPATYYIEINTRPTTRFAMVEVDFGEIKVIAIDEPGFVQINNTNRLGDVNFLHVLNDKYVRFETLRVNGNIIDQKMRLQPGTYKASFNIRPGVPQAGTKEITFKVRSNQTTQLTLE